MAKPIFIHNDHSHIEDLSDILRIARSIGKKVLNTEKVNVKPLVYPFQNGFWVVVSKYDGHSQSKGEKQNEKSET